MLLSHARALAHTFVFQGSQPSITFHKNAVIVDSGAEDWEPIQSDPNHAPPVAAEDCGCGDTILIEDDTEDELN